MGCDAKKVAPINDADYSIKRHPEGLVRHRRRVRAEGTCSACTGLPSDARCGGGTSRGRSAPARQGYGTTVLESREVVTQMEIDPMMAIADIVSRVSSLPDHVARLAAALHPTTGLCATDGQVADIVRIWEALDPIDQVPQVASPALH